MVGIFESGSTALKVIEAGAMIVLNILSLLGNILVCLSVYRNSSLRTTTNLYIIALAVTDLIAATLVMPPATGVLITGRWPFGETACQIHAYFSLFVVYVSPVTMGLTALNRYIRICKSNQQYNLYFSKKKSRFLLGSAWIFVALFILIPRLTGLEDFHFVPNYAACLNSHLSNFGKILHYIVVLGLFFVLPLAVEKLQKSFEKDSGTQCWNCAKSSSKQQRDSHHKRNSTKQVSVCCRLCLYVVLATRLSHHHPDEINILFFGNKMPRNVQLLCTFFVNISNAINPFIYAGMNPVFRREFRKLLGCKFGVRVESSSSQQSSSRRPAI